ncbi:MAG: hypothetical protein Q9195_007147 [Heterodermia aff. obscurata]
MPLASSPVAYQPSSSPALETRKRPLPNESLHPAKKQLSEHDWSKKGLIYQLENRDDHLLHKYNEASKAQIDSVKSRQFIAESSPAAPLPQLGTSVFRRNRHLQGRSDATSCPRDRERLPFVPLQLGNSISSDGGSYKPEPTSQNLNFSDPNLFRIRTTSGKIFSVREKGIQTHVTYEQLIARRSTTETGKAQKSYYGIEIHKLLDQVPKDGRTLKNPLERVDRPQPSIEVTPKGGKRARTSLWTEKYRARKFTDLVGDERTHRTVLRWLKGWDPVVFPGSNRPKPKTNAFEEGIGEGVHRKIMLLTGPPGLGKTTLAHVCARQAGYEVVEINASDERSRDVVKGRIRDIVGTENVKGVNTGSGTGTVRKAGRPVCVVIDEVDGVVSGSSGGEGGFIKALMDLVALDSRNSSSLKALPGNTSTKKLRKGDHFRLLRPMILICNDVYHPSLRLLRSSSMVEVVHIRRPPLDKVVGRMRAVFEKEDIACDGDGVRRLCEAAWGTNNRGGNHSNSSNTGEGDIRSILVVGEWVASKLRAMQTADGRKSVRLTRTWVEKNVLENLSYGGVSVRGVGRGGAKEAVERVFQESAGFPRAEASAVMSIDTEGLLGDSAGVSEAAKQRAIERLREIVDMSCETDRIMTDCFAAYPLQPFQDDTYLSKPNAAYEWLHFHDCVSSKVHAGQEWELAGYLSQSTLGFHQLFASPVKRSSADNQKRWGEDVEQDSIPFSGPRADYEASEMLKQSKGVLQSVHSSLSIPLFRSFRSLDNIVTDLVPYLVRLLTPNVKPIVVGGSGEQKGIVSVRRNTEKAMLERAVNLMGGVGVTFERNRVDGGLSGSSSYVYRMEPPLDSLSTFETTALIGQGMHLPVRYAIRQALDQEYQKHLIRQSAEARQARYKAGGTLDQDSIPNPNVPRSGSTDESKISKIGKAKRDFFGRIIQESGPLSSEGTLAEKKAAARPAERTVWVSFHEGFSK